MQSQTQYHKRKLVRPPPQHHSCTIRHQNFKIRVGHVRTSTYWHTRTEKPKTLKTGIKGPKIIRFRPEKGPSTLFFDLLFADAARLPAAIDLDRLLGISGNHVFDALDAAMKCTRSSTIVWTDCSPMSNYLQ